MRLETYNRSEVFAVTLNSLSSDRIVTIWQPKMTTVETGLAASVEHVIQNGFVNTLRIYTKITSIPEVSLPELTVEMSRTQRLNTTRNLEWTSPRKHLNLYLAIHSGKWVKIGTVSILNIPPFRVFDLLEYYTKDVAIPLGATGAIGLSVENAGYGLLQGADEIVCSGMATTEMVVIPEEISPIKQTYNYGSVIEGVSELFIPEIPNKKQVTLTNAGSADIFLSIGKDAKLNEGICLKANGGSYEFNRSNHPSDLAIYAISSGSSLLTGMVGV